MPWSFIWCNETLVLSILQTQGYSTYHPLLSIILRMKFKDLSEVLIGISITFHIRLVVEESH